MKPSPEMVNVAYAVMQSTLTVRQYTGRGRPPQYVDRIDTIAQSARQLAEMVMKQAGIKVTSGIFVTPREDAWQHDECLICGRTVSTGCDEYLIDRDTLEVLPPDEESERGAFWAIGSECRTRYPGIENYSRRTR